MQVLLNTVMHACMVLQSVDCQFVNDLVAFARCGYGDIAPGG